MGIESDQLVYDYLSRVGDLAQQRALPSGDRMRLVTQLRANIDKVRTAEGAHSVSAVKDILKRFGSPDTIVEKAKEDPASAVPDVAVRPGQSPPGGGLAARLPRPRVGGSEKWRGRLPRPRSGSGSGGQGPAAPQETAAPQAPSAPQVPAPPEPPDTAASPPHLAGEDELDLSGAGPDWWRVEAPPVGGPMPGGGQGGDTVPGFTVGIELPEILKPPDQQPKPKSPQKPTSKPPRAPRQDGPGRAAEAEPEEEQEYEYEDEDEADDEEYAGRGSAVRDLLRSSGPLEVLAVAALLAGAVLGQWVAVVIGWLLAYASRRLTRAEAKWAALGVPGTVAAAALVWLWGRYTERWGEPVAEGAMDAEMADLFPVVVRAAAVASALFLLWRARRRLRA